MKKHIFKNILNTFIYIVALFISVGVICFCGWLVYFCLNEYFSHTCCNDPCKDANYIVAAVTALVGIAASVISFVSMIKNTYSKKDERTRFTVEFIEKFKTDIESLYFFIIVTKKYNKEIYKYNRGLIKYSNVSDKFELNLSSLSVSEDEKKKIADLFTSNNYLNGWINAIRNSNYSFILQDKDDNTLLFKGSNLSDSESKYLLNKNFGNFAQLIRKFCKILDDTIFSIYKLNFDKKLINEFLENYFNKVVGIASIYICLNYNNGSSVDYKNLVNYLKKN